MTNRFLLALAAVATVALSVAGFTARDIALGNVPAVWAQATPGQGAPGGPGGRGNQRFAKMLMSLNLSDDQKNQIRSIMAAARAKAKTLTDIQAKRDTMRGAFSQIETVLTPAQRTKLHAERDAFKAQHASDTTHS
jgi:Spy/CpxP family protein refolding chaperone